MCQPVCLEIRNAPLFKGASGAEKLAEEFADLTDEDFSALSEQKDARTDETQKEDYWDKLEKEWKEMATQQGSILVLFQFKISKKNNMKIEIFLVYNLICFVNYPLLKIEMGNYQH